MPADPPVVEPVAVLVVAVFAPTEEVDEVDPDIDDVDWPVEFDFVLALDAVVMPL